MAYAINQSGFLGQRNEFNRRHIAQHRVVPAQQGLIASQHRTVAAIQRLVVQRELVGFNGTAQVLRQLAAGLHLAVHRHIVKTESAAPIGLGPV